MVMASDKLSQELVKVHEQYDDSTQKKRKEKAELAAGMDEPDPEDAQWAIHEGAEKQDHAVKTNENEEPVSLNLSVWKEQTTGRFQLRCKQEDGQETKFNVTEEMTADTEELFWRVGISSDDPPRIVLSELLGEKEVKMPPDDTGVLCRVHRFDAWRYYVSGHALSKDVMSEYVITKDDLETQDDASS